MAKIIFDRLSRWNAPTWVARNLAAHLDVFIALTTTKIRERFSELLAGHATVVDLSTASSEEMAELLEAAEFSRQAVKRKSKWGDPASESIFITAFDRFLDTLRMDRRVASNTDQ